MEKSEGRRMKLEEAIELARQLGRNGDDSIAAWLEELRQLRAAHAEKRVLVLPCEIGGTLYRAVEMPGKGKKTGHFVREITLNENNLYRITVGGEYGKTVFLTRREAQDSIRPAGPKVRAAGS